MNGPTGYITIRVRMTANSIILQSGGTSYEVFSGSVFVLPKEVKRMYGEWNPQIGCYVTLTSYGEVLHVQDNILPSQLNLQIKYTGPSVRRFITLLEKIMMKYYKGNGILRLPFYDREAKRVAIALARMASLQPISDIV